MMKRITFLFTMFLAFALNASTSFMPRKVEQTCFEKADEEFNETDGTHQEKYDAFIKEYDECMEEGN
ncbi:hypothetical protein [Zunongwangia endophytica]|uniref:Uncharacterized protein n=1 Tax=Zunongwangia endophytica TaxID=1808945 RepID=A0ABV8H3R4_9FLAO|nr:hypothetical protein [Zunongwangia endophytica]MDN3595786.1 hypothetical protein [Zunongwangia endophytica]